MKLSGMIRENVVSDVRQTDKFLIGTAIFVCMERMQGRLGPPRYCKETKNGNFKISRILHNVTSVDCFKLESTNATAQALAVLELTFKKM